MAETFNKIAQQIKNSECYKMHKRSLQDKLNRAISMESLWIMLDIINLCNIKISLSDFLKMEKEGPEIFADENIQNEFITARFREHGINTDFDEIGSLSKTQFALCMYIAAMLWYEENL